METLILYRHPSENYGTFGNLFRNKMPFAVTCEPINPAIEAGHIYTCIPHTGYQFKDVWEVTNVPGHTAILIHNGNTVDDTHGCILVGSTFGIVDGKHAVINSVNTLNMMRETLPDTFYLDVRPPDQGDRSETI